MIAAAVVTALVLAAWVGAGHVPVTAPMRAGVAGAARASAATGWAVGQARWAAGADARAARRAERMTHQRWRAAYRATAPVRAAGRGVAVVAPAVWAGARAARGGWVDGYRAEKDRRAGTGPTPGPGELPGRGSAGPDAAPSPAGPPAGDTTAPGPTPDAAPDPATPDNRPADPEPADPAPAGPTLTVVPDPTGDRTVTAPMDAEITDLTTLSAVLRAMEVIAEEMQNVSRAAKSTHLLAACEFSFDPGHAVRAALDAASETAPASFDADAWHSQIVAARQAVDALQQQATELTDTGASGHTDQLAAS